MTSKFRILFRVMLTKHNSEPVPLLWLIFDDVTVTLPLVVLL